MGHDQGGAAEAELIQGLLNQDFRGVIQGAGGLIQDQDGGILQEDPGDAEALLLAAAEADAALADLGIIAMGEAHDVIMDIGPLRRLNDLLLGGVQAAVADILPHGVIEEIDILLDDADIPADALQGQGMDLLAVQEDLAAFHIIEMGNEMADGGLAAAGGAYEGILLAALDIQIDMAEDFLILIIGIGDIPELDMAGQDSRVPGVRGVGLRLFIHDLAEALEAGDAVFELLHEVDEGHDGIDEHIDGDDEGAVIPELNLAPIEEEAAGDEDHDIEDIRDEGVAGMEAAHGVIGIPAGEAEPAVALLKLLLLLVRVGEGLGDPDAADGAFQGGVDIRHGRPGIPEGLAHLAAEGPGDDHEEGDAGEDDEGEPDIDGAEIDEGDHDADDGDDDILRAMVGQLADIEEVVGHAGHDLAGLMGVIEAIGKGLQMGKHIRAHPGLHIDAHHMALILNEVIQEHLDQIKAEEGDAIDDHEAVVAIGNEVIEHEAGDHGIHDADQGHQEGRAHVHGEEAEVGFIVGHEAAEKAFGLISGALGGVVFHKGNLL